MWIDVVEPMALATRQVAEPAESWDVLVWNLRAIELVVPAHQGKERKVPVGIPRAGVVGQRAAGVAQVAQRDS